MSKFLPELIGDDIQKIDKSQILKSFKDAHDRTPLMAAVLSGANNIVQLLSETQSGLKDSAGFTALMLACFTRNSRAARLLAPRECGQQSTNGTTALMCAALSDFSEAAELLKDEIGLQNVHGHTALMLAVMQNNPTIAKLLLREVDKYDSQKLLAIHYAVPNADLVKLVQTETAKAMFIFCVRQTRNADFISAQAERERYRASCTSCAQLFIDKIDETDTDGSTALMALAELNLVEMMPLAASQKKQRNQRGETALMIAAKFGSTNAAKQLLETEKGLQDSAGCCSIHRAAEAANEEIFQMLSYHESNLMDNDGRNALHYAARGKAIGIVRIILRSKPLVDPEVLKCAVAGDAVDVLQILSAHCKIEPGLAQVAVQTDSVQCLRLICQKVKLKPVFVEMLVNNIIQLDNAMCFLALPVVKNAFIIAAENGSLRIVKHVADAARTGQSYLGEITPQEAETAKTYAMQRTSQLRDLPDGMDALAAAVAQEQSDAVRILVYVYQSSCCWGLTPLMIAAQRGSKLDQKAMSALATRFGGQRAMTMFSAGVAGQTALAMAVQQQQVGYVRLLASKEAGIADEEGKTPLDIARELKDGEIVKLLMDAAK